jgi:hypothetical protein
MAAPDTKTRDQIYQEIYARFMQMEVPPCPQCGTCNTASVQVGIVSHVPEVQTDPKRAEARRLVLQHLSEVLRRSL